jgi:hypothetical protein
MGARPQVEDATKFRMRGHDEVANYTRPWCLTPRCLLCTSWNGYRSSLQEIDAIQRQFVQFDRNVDGGLSQQEVRVMMQDVFPGVSSSARLRPQLLKILEEAGATGTDPDRKLSFAKFIKLMRCLHDLKDQDPVVRQSDIIAYTRFSPKEVEEFQLIFTRATQRDLMGPNEFIQMVGGCCTIDDNYKDMLRRIFTEVVEVDACSRNATFPDFLLLMRRIVDMDFAHIQDGLFAFGTARARSAGKSPRGRMTPSASPMRTPRSQDDSFIGW